MRVLVVSQPVSGGVAVCVRQLVEAAVRAGHSVTVACPSEASGPLAEWISTVGATHVPLEMARRPAPRDMRDVLALRRLARQVDVVHLHSSKAGALGRVATRSLVRRRPPVVFTPHAWSWLVGGRLAPLYRFIERTLAGSADRIVAVSHAEAHDGRAVLGKSAHNLTVIVNGVDRDRFSPHGRAAGRDQTKPLIVCVGRLSEQKGQDLALAALAKLANTEARLRLVGSGPEKQSLEALAKSLGIADRVEWVDHQPDPALEYRSADVVFAPSRWDGMSLVLLEAMACGRALVATSVLGSEAVGSAGVIVDIGNVSQMTLEIDALLADSSRRHEIGEAARDRSSEYDLAATLRENLALWMALVEG